MTFEKFRSSLGETEPPEMSELLRAMWYDAKNDWTTAHNIAQEIQSRDGSLIHAYLHRKEGDNGNAAYWYHQAGRPVPVVSLPEEWENIVREFLKSTH